MPGDATIVSGRRVVERYRLVAPRGDAAWDAVDETLRRNVVVHVLSADADAAAKEHFTAEARTLARLNHRNVVATYDTGVDGDGTSYRVDELAGGKPLDLDAVADEQRLSFAVQTARALSDAHAVGLVHGALTSAHILVGDEGRVQVRGLRLLLPDDDLDAAKQTDIAALSQIVLALAPARPAPLRDLASRWRADPPTSVGVVLDELEALPDDQSVAIPEPTPSHAAGVPPVRRRGRQGIVAAVAALVIAAVAAAVVLPAARNDGDFGGPPRALALTAKSFDPEARPPTENEPEARLAVDGNAATAWKTERYRRPNFGNLKSGVGLVLQAKDGASEFDQVVITSPTRGWDVQVYVAEQPAAELSGWGSPVANASVSAESTTLALDGAPGGAILLWITDPGPTRQVRINEVTVQGRA